MIKYPNIDPVIFTIFHPIALRWYSLAYIVAILLGYFLIKIKLNFKKETMESLLNYVILGLIFGARIFYILFYDFKFYFYNPLKIFYIWEGGLSFHGGVFGISLSVVVFAKKNKISFYKITDLIVLIAPIGIFLGRIANFINGELFGRVSYNFKYSIIFPTDKFHLPRHPSQIYEAFFEGFVLFFLMIFFNKKNFPKIDGVKSYLFIIFYSIFRFFIEFFREADLQIGYYLNIFTQGQIFSILSIIFGLFMLKFLSNGKKN